MVKIELLHMRDFRDALVELLNPLIPTHRPTMLQGLRDDIHIDRMINNIRHQLFQNAFGDTWKDFCLYQLLNQKLAESCRKAQLVLGFPSESVKILHLI